jgi:aminopeptidase YwaD
MDTQPSGTANFWRAIVDAANRALPDPFDRLNRDIDTYRERQDGAVFSARGEEVLVLFEGLSNRLGGGELIPEYHQPTDDVEKILRDNGGNKLRRVRDLLTEVIKRASNR